MPALASAWAYLLSVVGIAVTVVGVQTSAFLFDWASGDTLIHRDRVVVGGALLLASALVWWRVNRRTPAVISAGIAIASVTVAFAAPGSLFLLALASPALGILEIGAAIAGLAAGSGGRSSRLVVVGVAGAALATAALLGLGPALGLVGVIGAIMAGGAVATLLVRRGDARQGVDASDPARRSG